MSEARKLTIAELEAVLNAATPDVVEILPNGEVTATSILDTLRQENQQLQQRVVQLEGAARKVWETIPATYSGTAAEAHARALVALNALVQQALQPPAPTQGNET